MVHLIHKAMDNKVQESKYSWQSGLLRRNGKLVLGDDPELKKDLLKYFHKLPKMGHSGMDATIKRIGAIIY